MHQLNDLNLDNKNVFKTNWESLDDSYTSVSENSNVKWAVFFSMEIIKKNSFEKKIKIITSN